MLKSKKY